MKEQMRWESGPPSRGWRWAAVVLAGLGLWLGAGREAGAAAAEPLVFQPAFHQAIRWSTSTPRATYRVKIPVGRAGSRVRLSFKAGDGALHLYAATLALAGQGGALASPAVPLTFGGAPEFDAKARQRVTSDPVDFPVSFGADVYVSFEAEGALASSSIGAFPDSFVASGSHAADPGPIGGSEYKNGIGLDTLDVEAPPGNAFVAVGDSITEGYSNSETDDVRKAWPTVAQNLLGLPVVNAAVSSQVVQDAIDHLDAEVFTLQGITDCVVLLGTNDLGAADAPAIEARLDTLFTKLRPFCRVWAGTLLPKQYSSLGALPLVNDRRQAVNAWIRTQAQVAGVIDFEAVLRRPEDANQFQDGLVQDGVHPTFAGQQRMGEEAARVLGEQTKLALTGVDPPRGMVGGSMAVTLNGSGFKPGLSVFFGGTFAPDVQVAGPTAARVMLPARSTAGAVDVTVTDPDGQSVTLPRGFVFTTPSTPVSNIAVVASAGSQARGCSSGSAPSALGLIAAAGLLLGRRGRRRRS